ncbi:MAG: asparagine synthase (glutamine-hydrolyzing) [Actinobacteria bacterium]|nr:asparagine synthase (glutamine-hydrolyzing) [Actinomycetota bacterium]MDA8183893.1 asparagine synthase (glutamine-hydrolyzing) [Actinomycetota bacterium]
MCGIAGILDASRAVAAPEVASRACAMAARLAHRGPDDRGEWADPSSGIAFAFRRLSVQDPSPSGSQPMHSACGRYVMVFNGEIYNFRELRRRLPSGVALRGGSDTEVLVEAVSAWGLERTLEAVDGMFAFALWDAAEQRLSLARDRLGEKPLYYSSDGRLLIFASELSALEVDPACPTEIDRHALSLFFRYGHVPTPLSILRNVRKLPPGSVLHARRRGDHLLYGTPDAYWSLARVVAGAVPSRVRWSLSDAADRLDLLLRDSVRRRMISDVPVGAFLSGGIDSSTVTALMQAEHTEPVRTFTIGFEDPSYDESGHARAVAAHLGTEHTEICVSAANAMSVIPRLASIYDEPFADSSQVPTLLLAELTRRDVTVALSGDGGDELFGGYDRYFMYDSIMSAGARLAPQALRRLAAAAMLRVPEAGWDRVWPFLYPVLPDWARKPSPGRRVHKVARAWADDFARDRGARGRATYLPFISHWDDPAELLPGEGTLPGDLVTDMELPAGLAPIEQGMFMDLLSYFPEDILVKVDRAAMSCALETRMPLLDRRIVELSWAWPLSVKARAGTSKLVLREVLSRYVPPVLFDRPKMGFGLPLGEWLRGPLRGWAEDLLSTARLAAEGHLDPSPVRRIWKEHLSGETDWRYRLWDVLMFESWLDSFQSDRALPATPAGGR